MRFSPDGPDIPDELLEQRDQGNVVFFCGAGISRPAGLPGFKELTTSVMEALGADKHSESWKLFQASKGQANLDQVFELLQQEYSRNEVEELVSALLKTPRRALLRAHSTILRLSRTSSGRSRVVTTNFDHLFEGADASLPTYVAPALPDIRTLGFAEGVIYLHGRRPSKTAQRAAPAHRLVLSSSDFGLAYLAGGWATRFVRDLLEKYVIVLVGYSASDPPVRYPIRQSPRCGMKSPDGSRSMPSGSLSSPRHQHIDYSIGSLTA